MTTTLSYLRKCAELVAALMMAAMFFTFVVQIAIRYSARLEWLPNYLPFLEPTNYGWTLEFCLALWVWLVFWGNAFVVRDRDHVTFDILYNHARPNLRRVFVVIGCLAIAVGFLLSIDPTLDKFHILRLKKTATLSSVFGDWIRMRHIYAIYILFLGVVALRCLWAAYSALRHGAPEPTDEFHPE